MGRPFPHVQAWGRHCADNNAGAQRYPFFGSFSDIWRSRHSGSPGGGTHVQKLGTLVGAAIREHIDTDELAAPMRELSIRKILTEQQPQ